MSSDKKISELPTASPLTGAEYVPVVQDTETRKTLISSFLIAGDWYLFGDSVTDGSIRIHFNSSTNELLAQKRISGVWTDGAVICGF